MRTARQYLRSRGNSAKTRRSRRRWKIAQIAQVLPDEKTKDARRKAPQTAKSEKNIQENSIPVKIIGLNYSQCPLFFLDFILNDRKIKEITG